MLSLVEQPTRPRPAIHRTVAVRDEGGDRVVEVLGGTCRVPAGAPVSDMLLEPPRERLEKPSGST